MLALSEEQRQSLDESGTPLPLVDRKSGRAFVLLEVLFSPAKPNGVRAIIEGMPVVGDGDMPDDALFAYSIGLKSHLNAAVADDQST